MLGLDRGVVVEHVAHDAGAARQGHELALEADQAARRDAVVEAHAALAVGLHVLQLAAAAAQLFHHRALVASSTSTVSTSYGSQRTPSISLKTTRGRDTAIS